MTTLKTYSKFDAFALILLKKIDEWESKPKKDGYEYEKSFIEVMQSLNEKLLQLKWR